MRWSRILVIMIALAIRSSGLAAQPPDPTLLSGLKAWQENGAEAAVNLWYSYWPDQALEVKNKLFPAIEALGTVIDSEVIATQPISNRVTRYYVAVYFTRAPLWLRIERYANGSITFYLPLRFSTNPDHILPSYLTEYPL